MERIICKIFSGNPETVEKELNEFLEKNKFNFASLDKFKVIQSQSGEASKVVITMFYAVPFHPGDEKWDYTT